MKIGLFNYSDNLGGAARATSRIHKSLLNEEGLQSPIVKNIHTKALEAIIEKTNSVNIYPNPTNENITISVNNFNGNIKTEVFDLIGNRLQTTNETTISLQDYARGIYLLKVSYSDRVEEMKVIKD